MPSDLCLNQVVPLRANVFEECCDVDGVLLSYLLQHAVKNDVGACPAHPSTSQRQERKRRMRQTDLNLRMKNTKKRVLFPIPPAVDHHRLHAVRPASRRLADEAEQWNSELWDPHVGPLGVMVLHHNPLIVSLLLGSL